MFDASGKTSWSGATKGNCELPVCPASHRSPSGSMANACREVACTTEERRINEPGAGGVQLGQEGRTTVSRGRRLIGVRCRWISGARAITGDKHLSTGQNCNTRNTAGGIQVGGVDQAAPVGRNFCHEWARVRCRRPASAAGMRRWSWATEHRLRRSDIRLRPRPRLTRRNSSRAGASKLYIRVAEESAVHQCTGRAEFRQKDLGTQETGRAAKQGALRGGEETGLCVTGKVSVTACVNGQSGGYGLRALSQRSRRRQEAFHS